MFLDQKPPWSNPALIIPYQRYPFPKPSPNLRVSLLRSYLPGYFFFFFLTSWRANLLFTSKRSSSWEACFCVFFFYRTKLSKLIYWVSFAIPCILISSSEKAFWFRFSAHWTVAAFLFNHMLKAPSKYFMSQDEVFSWEMFLPLPLPLHHLDNPLNQPNFPSEE